MKFVINETIYSWRKTYIFNILLIILFTLLFWIFTIIISYYADLPAWLNYESQKNGYGYHTMSYFTPEESDSEYLFSTHTFDTVGIEKRKLTLYELQNSNDYKYMSITHCAVAVEYDDIKKRIDDNDFINFMTGSLYPGYFSDFPHEYNPVIIEPHPEGAHILRASNPNAYRINESFMKHFCTKIKGGRLFAPEDFIFQEGQADIPILLGSEYGDKYKVGDSFKIDLNNLLFDAKVIGILEKNCIIVTDQMTEINGHPITLDYSMIIPFFDIQRTADSEDDLWFDFINYDQQLQGVMVVNSDMIRSELISIQKKISQTFVKNGLYPVNFDGAPYGMVLFQKETSQTIAILLSLVITMGVFGVLSICFCLITKINRNIRRYAIQLMNGQNLKFITLSFIMEILGIVSLAIIASSCIMLDIISQNIGFLLVTLSIGTLVAISVSSVIVFKLKGLDIEELIRGKE